jgi:hypothetical protein
MKQVWLACSLSSSYTFLTLLQLARPAKEREEQARREYWRRMSTYDPEQVVYVDESGVNRKTTQRTKGWAPIGERAWRHDYFVRGSRCVYIFIFL